MGEWVPAGQLHVLKRSLARVPLRTGGFGTRPGDGNEPSTRCSSSNIPWMPASPTVTATFLPARRQREQRWWPQYVNRISPCNPDTDPCPSVLSYIYPFKGLLTNGCGSVTSRMIAYKRGEVDCSDPQWNFSAALLPVRLMTQSSSWWSKALVGRRTLSLLSRDLLPLHTKHRPIRIHPPPGGCVEEGPALDHGGPGAPPGPRLPPRPVPRGPRPPGMRCGRTMVGKNGMGILRGWGRRLKLHMVKPRLINLTNLFLKEFQILSRILL